MVAERSEEDGEGKAEYVGRQLEDKHREEHECCFISLSSCSLALAKESFNDIIFE